MPNGKVDWKASISLWVRRLLFEHGLVVAFISLLLALAVGVVWAVKAYTVIELAKQTLSSERVPTAQKYKGIESFVLSGLDEVPVNATKIHDDAKVVFDDMSQHAYHPVGPGGRQLSTHTSEGQLVDQLAAKLRIEPSKGAHSLREQYLTDELKNASLYVPAIVFSGKLRGTQAITTKELPALLMAAPQLVFDILASRAIAGDLQEFSGKPLFVDNPPSYAAQAYFIARTGVLRIWRQGAPDAPEIYEHRFDPHRFFPERPLFWPTVESDKQDIAGFDFSTKAYVDLGGNGPVRTFCNAIGRTSGANSGGPPQSVRKLSDVAVCVDVQLPVDIEAIISERLRPFGNNRSVPFKCTINTDLAAASCDGGNTEEQGLVEANLKQLVKNKKPDDMLGNLYVLNQQLGPQRKKGWKTRLVEWSSSLYPRAGKVLNFLLPGGPEEVFFTLPKGLKSGTAMPKGGAALLLFEMDLASPQWENMWFAFLAILFLAISLVSVFFAHQARRLGIKFLQNLETVMEVSPVGFCHLDESDQIVDSNKAFQDFTGYCKEELGYKKFEALLANDSRARYALIQSCRERLDLTDPYEVKLVGKAGEERNVIISGAPVHMPRRRKSSVTALGSRPIPHTFGILVVPKDAKAGYLKLDLPFEEFKVLVERGAVIRSDVI